MGINILINVCYQYQNESFDTASVYHDGKCHKIKAIACSLHTY